METVFENANGGTELMMRRLYGSLDHELLSRFQIIPNWGDEIDRSRIPILWLHNMPDMVPSELGDPDVRKQLARIVMVSDWQMSIFNTVMGIKYAECEVIRNGIQPVPECQKTDPNERIDLIFHTVPSRGLSTLIAAFDRIAKMFERVHLHVFSSFQAYGMPQFDIACQPMFDWCRRHPCVTYHGFQPNDVVRRALQTSHIFAYPSIWRETSCLAAIEAMSAGNLVVAPNLGGLLDTCNRWSLDYQWTENGSEHVDRFVARLSDAINGLRHETETYRAHLAAQKAYVDRHYDWNRQALVWERMLTRLCGHQVNT